MRCRRNGEVLDLRLIRERPDEVRKRLEGRGEVIDLEGLLAVDGQRRKLLQQVEGLRHAQRQASEAVSQAGRAGGEQMAGERQRLRSLALQVKALEGELQHNEARLREALLRLPNLPHPSVPIGSGAQENVEVRRWGTPQRLPFAVRSHVELGERLGILDFERGAKIAGARFALYRGAGARLERALSNFMMDIHTQEHGYLELLPPCLVNRDSMIGTGQLPRFQEELYQVERDGLYLIPTAEVSITNVHQGEVLQEEKLPLRYAACTPCFRREAGSYGQDTRGLIRQHQFNKVELVKFTPPDTSYSELDGLVRDVETVLQRLALPYRVVDLCTGDLGFAAAKTYDLEVWIPSQETYREISSCSNFEEFQARRARIRYRQRTGGRTRFLHTLNGSGLAIGRTVVALMETGQQADGRIRIPEALVPYMGGVEVIG